MNIEQLIAEHGEEAVAAAVQEVRDAKYKAAWHRQRKLSSQCAGCGQSVVDGKTRCPECSARNAVSRASRYAKLKANKQCWICRQPAVDGKTRCPKCATKKAARHAVLCAKLKANKQCQKCGQSAIEGKTLCQECLANEANRGATRRDNFIAKHPTGITYFVAFVNLTGAIDWVNVGKTTTNPKRPCNQGKIGVHTPKLLGYLEGADREAEMIERWAHVRAPHSKSGESLLPDPELLAWINGNTIKGEP